MNKAYSATTADWRPQSRPDAAARARQLGWIGYGALAAGALLYIVTIWLEVYLDTRKAGAVAISRFDESHRHWRVRSAFLFLIWSILGGFTLPLGIGWLFLVPAYLWYLLRVAWGLLCFARGRPMRAN